MSENSTSKKWAVYLILGGTGIFSLYLVITSFLVNPVNTYSDMFKKQYDALMKKMKTYTATNPEGWTEAQKQNVNQEESILSQTAAGLADASQGVYDLATYVIEGAVAVGVSAVVAKNVVNYFKGRSGGTIRTGQGAAAAATKCLADQLVLQGYPTYATNMLSSAHATFQAYDLPYMQATVNQIQASLPLLSGIQLIVAQQMIEAITIEIAVIPAIYLMPPPII